MICSKKNCSTPAKYKISNESGVESYTQDMTLCQEHFDMNPVQTRMAICYS